MVGNIAAILWLSAATGRNGTSWWLNNSLRNSVWVTWCSGGEVGYRHCGGRKDDLTIVTASVDGMCTFANMTICEDMALQGYLTYVGKSSMEVGRHLVLIEICIWSNKFYVIWNLWSLPVHQVSLHRSARINEQMFSSRLPYLKAPPLSPPPPPDFASFVMSWCCVVAWRR